MAEAREMGTSAGSFGKRITPKAAMASTPVVRKTRVRIEPPTPTALLVSFQHLVATALFFCLAFIMVVYTYGSDLTRDSELAGTFVANADIKVQKGSCSSFFHIVNFCDAHFLYEVNGQDHLASTSFLTTFVTTRDVPLVPVVSTQDRSAISVTHAIDNLSNRTISFSAVALVLAGLALASLFALLDGRYKGGRKDPAAV